MPAATVSAVGRRLERELGLAGSNDTLARWMAYRIAELMREADIAIEDTQRAEATRELERLIVDLWEKRTSLPGNADPNKRLEKTLRILDLLIEDRHSWLGRPVDPENDEDVASALEHSSRRSVLKLGWLKLAEFDEANPPEERGLPLTQTEQNTRKRMDDLSLLLIRITAASEPEDPSQKPSDKLRAAILDELDTAISAANELKKRLTGKAPKKAPKWSRRSGPFRTATKI